MSASSIRATSPPVVPRLLIDTHADTANGWSLSKSPTSGAVIDPPGRTVNAFFPSRRIDQSNPSSRVAVRSFPAAVYFTALPFPSSSGAWKTSPSAGTRSATSSGSAVASQASNSGRAAALRASSFFLASATRFETASHAARSSGRGTGTTGGVLAMFPSRAPWVVLLKNADSE